MPSRVPSANARAMITTADAATMIGTRSNLLKIHSYLFVSQVMTGFCHGDAPFLKRNVASTGTSVRAQIREPIRAEHTVNAHAQAIAQQLGIDNLAATGVVP